MDEQRILGRKSERSTSVGSNEELFSDLKKLLVEVFGTPWWISDLSAMEDEVRDRTILVKIKSQMYSVDDLVIYHVFSEIGVVEDVICLPAESGFHSQVRFGSKHSRDWACNYYSGRFLHRGCCELEVYKGDDLISWNAQKIDEIKATYGISDVPVETCDANLHEEKLKYDELICQEEEPSQVVVQNEPNLAKVPSDFTAHQVLDEMPESQNCIEHEPCVELSKYNGQGVFEMAGDLSQDLVDGDHDRSTDEVLEIDGDLSQDLVALHVLEEMPQSTKTLKVDLIGILTKDDDDDDDDDLFELASWIEEDCEPPSYAKGYMRLMCFDPGGGSLPLIDNSLGLERGGRDLLVTDSLKFELPLQEKCGLWCIDELLPEMTNAFQISLFGVPVHNPFNLESDQDKENIGLQNLVLETDMFGSVACFETFCFDPGGNSDGVLLERHIVDYELSEFVAWKLVEMEPENSAHYVVLSNLYAEMGRWADVSKVRGLMKERALMKAFEMYADKSLLQSEHMTEICFFAKNPSPQTSKGDEMLKGIFLEVKKKFETAMGIIRREKITIDPIDPAAVQQWKGFITRTNFCLILGDKDRLKEGVLLQDFSIEPGLSRSSILLYVEPV